MSESRREGEKGRGVLREVFGEMPLPSTSRTFDTSYEAYWEEREATGVIPEPARRRARRVLPFLSPGDTVLDVGCGTGETLEVIREVSGIEGTGLDVSQKALSRVASKGFPTLSVDLTAEDACLPSVYDHIILFEVVEHIADAEAMLSKLKGCFRKTLFITTPNLGYVAHRLRMLFGRFPVTYMLDPREHVRYWTTRDFRVWLSWLGYSDVKILGLRGKPASLKLYRAFPSLWASEVLYVIKPSVIAREANDGA